MGILAALCLSWAPFAQADEVRVPRLTAGSPAAHIAKARRLRRTDRARAMSVVVGLKLRHQEELDSLLRQLRQPGSPQFRRYLSSAEFDERFGPRPAAVTAVVDHLTARGLRIADVSPSRQLITAVGSAAAVEKVFGVQLVDFDDNGELFFGPDREPTLPPEIRAVVGSVQGLDDWTRLRAQSDPPMLPLGGGPYAPSNIATAYNFGPLYERGIRGDTSRAATIAIATAYGLDQAAIGEFWRALGIARPANALEVVAVGGAATQVIAESTLDVEWAGAMAPGSRILAYVGADSYVSTFVSVYDRIVSDNRAAVMSISWGLCETHMPAEYLQQTHALFQKAAALGITVVAASGDSGAFDCGPGDPSVNYPASDPLVVAVGGTSLRLDAAGRRSSEVAWGGSGGGQSSMWARPEWQTGGAGWRRSADVALNADPATGYYVFHDHGWWQYGGTSVATPIWAALFALANQLREQQQKSTVGLATPALCDVAIERDSTGPIVDITAGDNGYYASAPGWDYPTGWGVPDASRLVDALAAPAGHSLAGGLRIVAYLTPLTSVRGVTIRLNYTLRCGQSTLSVSTRGLARGSYVLAVDGLPVADIDVGKSGRTRVLLPGVDPREHTVTLLDGSGAVVARGDFPTETAPCARMSTTMANSGRLPGASGQVTYRSRNGAESLVVRFGGLPEGEYEVLAGDRTVARLQVGASATDRATVVRFDSRGVTAAPSPVDLRCQPLRLRSQSGVVLELMMTLPGSDPCPAK